MEICLFYDFVKAVQSCKEKETSLKIVKNSILNNYKNMEGFKEASVFFALFQFLSFPTNKALAYIAIEQGAVNGIYTVLNLIDKEDP